jgi:hypothetical protein
MSLLITLLIIFRAVIIVPIELSGYMSFGGEGFIIIKRLVHYISRTLQASHHTNMDIYYEYDCPEVISLLVLILFMFLIVKLTESAETYPLLFFFISS